MILYIFLLFSQSEAIEIVGDLCIMIRTYIMGIRKKKIDGFF